jgi:hypothetical protein
MRVEPKFVDLPTDTKIEILTFFDLNSILKFRLLSRESLKLSQSKQIWKNFCLPLFQLYGDSTPSFDNFKLNYKGGFFRKETISLGGEDSKFSFFETPKETLELMFENQSFFDLGANYDTLSEWFKKIKDFEEIKEILNYPILTMEEKFLQKIGSILPKGDYKVANYLVKPTFIEPKSKSDYFTNGEISLNLFVTKEVEMKPYYRHQFKSKLVLDKMNQYHFLFPMQSELNSEVVKDYEKLIENGILPAVFCLSFYIQHQDLDYVWYDSIKKSNGDSILISLILDGHHKMRAASNVNKSIRVLNFVYDSKLPLIRKRDVNPLLQALTCEAELKKKLKYSQALDKFLSIQTEKKKKDKLVTKMKPKNNNMFNLLEEENE